MRSQLCRHTRFPCAQADKYCILALVHDSYPRAVMFLPGCAISAGFVHEREIDSAGNWPLVPGGTGL